MSPLFLQTSLWYELQYSSINLELDGKTLEELNKRGMLLKTKRRDMENYSQKNTLKFKDEIYFLCFFLSLSLSLNTIAFPSSVHFPTNRQTTFTATFSSQVSKSNQKWHIVVTLIKLQIISDCLSPLEC